MRAFLLLLCLQSFLVFSQNIHEDLIKAVRGNDEKNVLDLLRRGANPNYISGDSLTPLYLAVENCNSFIVQKLLEVGANPNFYLVKVPPVLCVAAAKNCNDILIALLEYGAKADIVDNNNMTPLLYSIENNNILAVDALLFFNANVNKQGNAIPLIYAVDVGADTAIIRLLLDKGANPWACTEDGKNVFHYCVLYDDTLVAKLILSYTHGKLPVCNGSSPLDYALKNYKKNISKLFIDSAKTNLDLLHTDCIRNDFHYLARYVRKKNSNLYLTPKFTHMLLMAGLSFGGDVFADMNVAVHESRYNLDFSFGFNIPLWGTRQYVRDNNYILQFWEKRYSLKVGMSKYFTLFYSPSSVKGIFADVFYLWSFGSFSGSLWQIPFVNSIMPCVGMWIRSDFFKLKFGYSYISYKPHYPHNFFVQTVFFINLK